ncbi:hypothetical protein TsFJ059_008001 [Trichoderma semiorbis]|uniref:Uncharacterized protein n=1 Tax=Trichoderma semiorbis TaxID=1491008 RepID=A0A9P8HG14_9HYPO|nr:hypothetical protein TsFJ059_008001 [Trichoderma semiorbis]
MPRLSGIANFNPDKDIPSLSGKVVLVTGGTAGLGKQSIQALAKHDPEHIYFTGRNQKAADAVMNDIKAENSGKGGKDTHPAAYHTANPNLRILYMRRNLGVDFRISWQSQFTLEL